MGSDLGFLVFERPVTPAELLDVARRRPPPRGDLMVVAAETDLVEAGGPRAWVVTFWSTGDEAGAPPLDAIAAALAVHERVFVGFVADHHLRGGGQLHGPEGVRGVLALPGAPWPHAIVPAVALRWLAPDLPPIDGDAACFFTERLVDRSISGRIGFGLARGGRWLDEPKRVALRGDWWERWRCVWHVERWAEHMVYGG